MADKNLKFTLDFIAKTAGLKDSAQLAEKLGAKLDDSSDSADALAKVMAATADKLEAEMKETAQIAELLGNALGPEMAAKIGQSKIDTIAGEFRAAGLDAKGAEEKIDQLADGVRRLDQVADSAGTLDKKIQDVGHSTDQSRSVMANFTGNAMQELPGMAGMFGPLNMAVGQFGEYAAEGNIKLGQMAQMVGPMLVVAGVIQQIAKAAQDAAKRTEDMRKAQKAFSDGSFDEAAKSLTTAYSSLYGELAKLGVGSDTVTRAILGQKDAQDEVLQATTRAGDANVGLQGRYMELNTILGHAQDAWVEQGEALDVNAERLATVKGTLTEVYGATNDAATATKGMRDAANDAADAIAEMNRQQEILNGTLYLLNDYEALLNLQQQFDDVKTSAAETYTAVAEGSMTAEEGTRKHNLEMIALKESVAQYGTEVLGLPPEQVSKIVADLTDANIDEVEETLRVLARNRTATIVANVVTTGDHAGVGDIARKAGGGPVSANTPYLVGEVGQELFVPDTSGTIIPADKTAAMMSGGKTAAMMSGGAGATVTYNVTINGSNMTADETVRALKEWERRNGTGWRS